MDTSKYSSVQHFKDNVVNPCMESTFHFLDVVVNALKKLHGDVLPLRTLHIGGDEIPRGAVRRSPACGATASTDADVGRAVRYCEAVYGNRGLGRGVKLNDFL